MHSSLLVSYQGKNVMIDCGEDWLGKVDEVNPHAIVITHGHPDHARGLKRGAPCAVYAPAAAWELMDGFDISERREIRHREPFQLFDISFEAFAVEHSIRAPAVGYRVTAGEVTVFYGPDLVYIHQREQALKGARLYIGDGATITRSFVRKRGDQLIGHAPIRTQLAWCQKEGVPRAIMTHCGSQIVEGDERTLRAEIRKLAQERAVEAEIAYDGMEVVLR